MYDIRIDKFPQNMTDFHLYEGFIDDIEGLTHKINVLLDEGYTIIDLKYENGHSRIFYALAYAKVKKDQLVGLM